MTTPTRLSFVLLCALGSHVATASAQNVAEKPGVFIPSYEFTAEVYREYILVHMPQPYLLVKWPDPPMLGYYAWKMSFGSDPAATVVFRPDSALRATSNRQVVSVSSLRLCPPTAVSVLDCTTPLKGRARIGAVELAIEITDPAFVARIRERKPSVLLRQVFEPGGRFRVDHVGIDYKSVIGK